MQVKKAALTWVKSNEKVMGVCSGSGHNEYHVLDYPSYRQQLERLDKNMEEQLFKCIRQTPKQAETGENLILEVRNHTG